MSTATAPSTTAGTWKVDPVHSHVGFAVKHMVVATFRGRFEDYDGSLTVAEDGAPRLAGSVAVDSIAVKDENLAAHLQSPDFFDGANHPRISFVSDDVRLGDDGHIEIDGQLTIKGNTRPVRASGTLVGPHVDIAGNEKIGVELTTAVDRREYGLEWNAPLPKGGFALENEVQIEVSLELVREA
jgi:polyisoprenoid-binding protein YceI